MKYSIIALTACLLYSGAGFTQELPVIRRTAQGWGIDPVSPGHKCGTWEAQKPDTSDWVTIDTIGKKDHFAEARDWKYSEESLAPRFYDLMYRPCGGGESEVYNQYRICALTGIRQKRQRIISYKYIEAPRTDFEKVTDSLYGTVALTIDTLGSLTTVALPHSIDSIRVVTHGKFYIYQDTLSYAKPPKRRIKK